MEHKVVSVNENNYKEKIKENFNKQIIILFSQREQPSLLYLTLALEQQGKFIFFQAKFGGELS